MGSLTNYAENKVLDHILKVTNWSDRPSTLYLALFTADPTETGALTNEADYTGYNRPVITFSAASARSIAQSGQVTFNACTGSSSLVSHWGIVDGNTPSAGNMIAYGAFTLAKTISSGYTPFVADAEITVSFSTGGIFTVYATSLLDWLFRAQTLAVPTNIYIGLFSSACTDGGTGTELSGKAYARAQCNSWFTATAGASYNRSTVTFAQATANWTTAIYTTLFTGLSGTTKIAYATCTTLQVLDDEYGRFLAGAFDITLT